MSNTQNLLYEDCPYTNFPAAADQFDRKADVDLTTKALVDQYYQYLGSNNFTAANELRQSNPGLKRVVISAEDINKLRDGMIAAQRLFLSDINEYLVRFSKPKGSWNKSTRYQKYNVVTYEDDTHAVQTYVAMPASETSLDIPIGAVPTDTNYWQRITLKGDKGDSGTGLTPRGLYRTDTQYYQHDMVSHANCFWAAAADTYGETPNKGSASWILLMEFSGDLLSYDNSGSTLSASTFQNAVTELDERTIQNQNAISQSNDRIRILKNISIPVSGFVNNIFTCTDPAIQADYSPDIRFNKESRPIAIKTKSIDVETFDGYLTITVKKLPTADLTAEVIILTKA